MKVAVAYTKINVNGLAATDAFAAGIEKEGDQLEIIKGNGDLWKLDRCDLAIMCCEFTKYSPFDLRHSIMMWAKATGKSRLIMDTGFFSANNKRFNDNEIRGRYYQIGLNGIKRDGLFMPPSKERWSSLNIGLKDFNVKSGPILVLGQFERGVSVQEMDVLKWQREIIDLIKELYPDEDVWLAPHPNQTKIPGNTEKYCLEYCKDATELATAIDKCSLVVALTTNASVDVILRGKPLFTQNSKCVCYDLASHNIEEIFDYTNSRDNLLHTLAANSYSIEEMESGACWRTIRQRLSPPLPV